jgi:teichuronic acid biosynthesis glycosyltransferase TuaH
MKVVVCSEVQWHYVRTRKQQILSRFPAHWPILYLQAYTRGRHNDWRPQHDGRVTYVTVPAFKSVPQPFLRGLLERGAVRAVGNAVLAAWVWLVRQSTGFGGSDVALYVSNIYFGRVLGSMRRRVAIYDCNDNHLAFPGTPAWARGYLQRIVRGVDAVVLSSTFLREEIAPLGPRRVVEIGNGVDFDHFDAAWRAPRPPEEITNLPGPRIGYAGALAEWIDLELLAATARSFPEASLVLVGPAVGSGIDPQAFFAGLPNVHWLGAKPHDALPHYVTAMDVCLIPFRSTPLTRGVNPNKLWEYLALGKPVVATDFSPFIREFGAAVRIGGKPPEFVAAVRAALAARSDAASAGREVALRRELARERGWDRAAGDMVSLLETLAAAR